jgi:hypothetical protein
MMVGTAAEVGYVTTQQLSFKKNTDGRSSIRSLERVRNPRKLALSNSY